tara:strand:- start:311 stop:529 length:219 start_codon:yes stop_codon:yes gene_type:complete
MNVQEYEHQESREQYGEHESKPPARHQAAEEALCAGLNLDAHIPQEEFGNLNIQERALGEESDESKENQRIF